MHPTFLPWMIRLPAMGVVLMVSLHPSNASDLAKMLPSQIQGWTAATPDGLYDAGNLFDLIDGGAEVYRALNVRAVFARRYVKEGSPEILADLFDMGSSSDAFGAFHHDLREGEPAGIGRESEYASGALAFWKGRYFVTIMALDETPATKGAVFDLARQAAGAILEEGEPPSLVRLLPDQGLVGSQVRYFHTQALLNRYYALAETNILNLSAGTEGILARRRPASPGAGEGSPYAVLIVGYASPEEAKEAVGRIRKDLVAEADAQGFGRLKNGRWACATAADRILLAVLDVPSRSEAERTMEEMARRQRGAEE